MSAVQYLLYKFSAILAFSTPYRENSFDGAATKDTWAYGKTPSQDVRGGLFPQMGGLQWRMAGLGTIMGKI